jgi:hypothetical protein
MTDTYPRLGYPELLPSSIPALFDGGWKHEAAARVYLESYGPMFGVKLVMNLDALLEATISRADYLVRSGEYMTPHVLEVKLDLRFFLNSIGEPGSEPFDGIRQDEEAYEPHNLAWPSILFTGYDSHGDRAELEAQYPGEVIVADEDAPGSCPTFSEFHASLKRGFLDFEERRAANEITAN